MRLGILGGTFDPPHHGHLLAASDAVEALSLDTLWFVPNATQPLKGGGHGSAAQRLDMVRLMVGTDQRFAVDAIEVDRQGISYTVDTLVHFADRYPESFRYFLVGADVIGTFDQWREPRRIRELAEVVILQRAGEERDVPAELAGARRLPTRRIDISSTEIRERVRLGHSIRGFVPDAVAAYIASTRLYQ